MTPASPRAPFLAAAAQMCATDDLAANLAVCRELAAEAARAGVSLLALPECFAFLGASERDKMAVAESLDQEGPILATLRAIGREHGMWVVGGGLPERSPSSDSKAYNTCVVLDPSGEIRAAYRKIHLFDVDIPGRAQLRESAATLAGSEVVAVDTDLCRLGLSICYDVRFPELYRELAMTRGADVLLVPAAFTAHTGAAHWHILLRARSIENQCFIIAPAQAGKHNRGRESYGHAVIIDPWGTILAERESGTGLAIAEIDPGVLARVREQMPVQQHRVLGVDREG